MTEAQLKSNYDWVVKELGININNPVLTHKFDFTNGHDTTERNVILTQILYFSSALHGEAVTINKSTKSGIAAGIVKSLEEINKAIRLEIENNRTIISAIKQEKLLK